MKKSLLIFLLLAAILTGCAGRARPYTVDDARALIDAGAFDGELAEVPSSSILALYGVEEGKLLEFVSFQTTSTAVSCEEVTVLVLADTSSAEAAESACRERIAAELENAKSYSPAAVPSLEAAIVDRVENTVLIAVGNPDKLPDAVAGLK